MQTTQQAAVGPPRTRQIVDWPVALLAGLIAGTVFLMILLFRASAIFDGATAWVALQYLASMVLGTDVLPPAEPGALIAIVGVIVHYVLSILFALTLAFITHRWGFIIGIIVGALFGLAVFFINMGIFTLFFPWMYVLNVPTFAIGHVFFGALAGAVYEGFERERFVSVDGAEEDAR
jgi:uncharacterized membrane protein YagU involved in acid resistance